MGPGRPRRVVVGLLLIWSCLLVRLTLWPQLATPHQQDWVRSAVAWLAGRGVPVTYLGVEAVANVLLFVPFGVLVALLLGARRWRVVVAGLVLSASIEITQRLALPGRVPSVQDVVLNTVGAALGWAALGAAVRRRR